MLQTFFPLLGFFPPSKLLAAPGKSPSTPSPGCRAGRFPHAPCQPVAEVFVLEMTLCPFFLPHLSPHILTKWQLNTTYTLCLLCHEVPMASGPALGHPRELRGLRIPQTAQGKGEKLQTRRYLCPSPEDKAPRRGWSHHRDPLGTQTGGATGILRRRRIIHWRRIRVWG